MNLIVKILQIADEQYDQEMDSWYYGSCDEVYEIAKQFNLKSWNLFTEATKVKKPDMWRVFLTHAFFEHEDYVGKSQDFIAFQAIKCIDSNDAYLIVQYMDNFDWRDVPMWLRNQMMLQISKMLAECYPGSEVVLNEIYGAIIEANS